MDEILINDVPVKIWARTVEPSAWRQISNLAVIKCGVEHIAKKWR